jgi:hypothetical protein
MLASESTLASQKTYKLFFQALFYIEWGGAQVLRTVYM